MKVKPLVTEIRGYTVIFENLPIEENFNINMRHWSDVPDYYVYLWINKHDGIAHYKGKGKKDPYTDWKDSRFIMHNHKDLLSLTLNPNDWYCVIPFMGLIEKESLAAEAYLIRESNRPRTQRGRFTWDGVSLINKRREHNNEKLIEHYLKFDGNNYWETARRETYYY